MANDYAYLEATVDEIELNTKKVTEIDDSTTYTEEQYPTVEAVKDYVNSHSSQITVDDALSDTSENPVQNKVIKSALDGKLGKTGGTVTGQLSVDVLSADTYVTAGMSVETPKVFGLNAPVNDNEAANKGYVDTAIAAIPVIAVDNALSDTSENPVQNKIVKSALDGKLNLSGGTMSGDLNMGLKKIQNMAFDPNNDGDTSAVTRKYVDYLDALNEKLANKITAFTGSETDTEYPSAKLVNDTITDITTQVGDALDGKLDLTGGTITGVVLLSGSARVRVDGTANPAIVLGSKRIGLVGNPVVATDAANKKYVDDAIAAALIVDTEEVIP